MRSPAFPVFTAVSAVVHVAIAMIAAGSLRIAPPPAPPQTDPVPALAGDTFTLEAPGDDGAEINVDDVDPTPTPDPIPTPDPTPIPMRRAKKTTTKPSGPAVAAQGEPGSSSAAMYGAVGERGAMDLAATFTRSFPNVASVDPIWATVPFGDAGSAEVTLTLDESGHLTGSSITGGASPALRAGISRTIGLIRGRVFTARAATTRIHVTARISPGEVRTAVNDKAYGVGGSFTGLEGNAFFRLPIGRDVDIRIRVR